MQDLRAEIERRGRIADTMLTAHSVLRDRFSRLGLLFDLVTFGASTALVATTFSDPELWQYFGIAVGAARIWTGVLSVFLFFLSLVGLLVDWKQRATRHREAVKVLSDIKAKTRELLNLEDAQLSPTGSEFLRAAAFALSELQPIPDAEFVALKAKHREKVRISTILDSHPSMLVWVVRWRLRFSDTCAAMRNPNCRHRNDENG